MVERALLTEEDVRDFVFTNAARLWAGLNPDFFQGTRCQAAVGQLLKDGTL